MTEDDKINILRVFCYHQTCETCVMDKIGCTSASYETIWETARKNIGIAKEKIAEMKRDNNMKGETLAGYKLFSGVKMK